MNPWIESVCVLLLAASGACLGAWFSRLPKMYWLAGYLIPLVLIILYGLGSHWPSLALLPPICWMLTGRVKFTLTGFLEAMVLTTPLLRLPKRRDRIAVSLLMVCAVFMTSVWPFLAPAFNRGYLGSLTTRLDGDGICRQSADYTCGPASAVTALRKLGFPAEEGEIAVLARTSSTIGTPPDVLAEVLRERYTNAGLDCEYRVFKNVAELRDAGVTLAVIKFSFMLDHYVTVMEVTDKYVVVGDPLSGLTKLPLAEFNDKWRFVGVVMKRVPVSQ